MKDQAILYPPSLTSPVERFANENYLDESQDTEFKQSYTSSKTFKGFKTDIKKHLSVFKGIDLRQNKCLIYAQESKYKTEGNEDNPGL